LAESLFNPLVVKQATAALVADLNAILLGPSIYDPTRFAGVEVLKSTDDLRLTSPTGERLIRLNRLLLEDAYPTLISRSLEHSFVVEVVTPGREWRLIRVNKVEAEAFANNKVEYDTQYTVVRDPATNVVTIREPWRGVEYRVGRGNFPLW